MSERVVSSVHPEDEVSLVDLIQILFRRRVLIGSSIVLCVLAGLVYAFLATPRYEVEVRVDKPFVGDIAPLNLGRNGMAGLAPFSPDQVFNYFSNQLTSDLALQQFFTEVYLPSLDEAERTRPEDQLREKMVQALRISRPDPKGRNLYALKVEADAGDKAVRYASEFLELAAREAADKLTADVRNDVNLLIRNTERDVTELRAMAAKQRQDRLVQLGEALQVAEAVGVREPQVTSGRLPPQDRLTPFLDGAQLYARGTKSLAAEVRVLKAREMDDAFTPGLREAESRLRVLKAIQPDPKTFKVFKADGEIMAPEKPVWPKKPLVLVFAVILGGACGLMLAFLAEFAGKVRNKAAA